MGRRAPGRVIAQVPAANAEDIDRAVAAAQHAFDHGDWPRMSASERSRILNRLADLIEQNQAEFSRLEAQNNGRPLFETSAQLSIVPEFFRYNAALALTLRGETVPNGDGYLTYLQYVPLGVAAIMTPFNHPMLIAARGIAPALATGNTVVVKPSDLTPLTTLFLGELAAQAGVPKGALNIVTGVGREAGAALANHPGIARIEFTGGTGTGRIIAAAAGERLGRVTAELGGKTPIVVFEDSPIMDAAAGVAFASFIAAGQSCVAGARILVQESVVEAFTAQFVNLVSSIKVGDPLDPTTQMGPVISETTLRRTVGYVQDAIAQGGVVLTGGRAASLPAPLDGGFFVEPTVIGNANEDMTLVCEEVFGPIVSIETFIDEADAARKANATEFGLGAAVWTRDIARGHRFASQIRAGMVWINDHHRLSPSMPWGGFKNSGIGKQAGTESFYGFLEKRSVIVRTTDGAPDWFTGGSRSRLN